MSIRQVKNSRKYLFIIKNKDELSIGTKNLTNKQTDQQKLNH